jgi:hypothetical protein
MAADTPETAEAMPAFGGDPITAKPDLPAVQAPAPTPQPAPEPPAAPEVPAGSETLILNPILATELSGGFEDAESGLHFLPGQPLSVAPQYLAHVKAVTYPRMSDVIPVQPTANELPSQSLFPRVIRIPLVVAYLTSSAHADPTESPEVSQ